MVVLLATLLWAQEPAADLTVALPLGDVEGDGQTEVTVHVLALKADGSPIEDLGVKLKSKTAKSVGTWTYGGGGIYSFTVMPPRVESPQPIWVRVKGKTPDKLHSIDLNAQIPLRPTPPLSITLSANPVELIAGERDEATLSFSLADGREVAPEYLRLRTSLGEVGALTSMGGGRYVAKLTVAKVKDPGLALITASDKRRPDRVFGGLTVPVSVKRDISVKAKSGASVLLEVAGRTFGPVEAKGGRAKVPGVLVPPGTTEAKQTTMIKETSDVSTVDLEVPPDLRLLFVPPYEGIPADPAVEAEIRLMVVTREGSPDGGARPEIVTDAGTVVDVRHEGMGIHVIKLKPALSAVARTAKISAVLPGEKGQRDEIPLVLTPARPARVSVAVTPDPLAGSKTATLTATLMGTGDQPLEGRTVRWNLTGAKAEGEAKAGTGGLVSQPITTFGGPVEVLATVPTAPSGNAAHQVVLVPVRSWVPADKISSTMLTIATLDVFGYPVAGVPVRLLVETGDGSLPKEVTTDTNGLAQVFYTAGNEAQVVRIRARVGDDASAAIALLQGPKTWASVALPVSGPAAHRAVTEAWRNTVVARRIEP
jgi:hypothetical protein